jgi:V8-like Glu-specific endopeptidase
MKTRALATALLSLTSCVVDPDAEVTGESQQAIVGGTATSERIEVGQTTISDGELSHTCTATMISNKVFLTAGHCIGYVPFAVGGTFMLGNGVTKTIARTFALAKDDYPGEEHPQENDLAVGILTTAVSNTTLAPRGISTTQPSNEFLTQIGFGSGREFITYWYDGSSSNWGESGDSGGPVFKGTLTAPGDIVRVHSGRAGTIFGLHDVGADAVAFRPQILAMRDALVTPGISYRAHVQDVGYQAAVVNNAVAGTTGQSKRLEGLQIWLNNGDSICYTAYVQDIGWQPEACDGQLAGTVETGQRIEAIRIRYVPPLTPTNVVHYRVYLQGTGWQAWKTNNAIAGTIGESRRVEAIQIYLTPADVGAGLAHSAPPAPDAPSDLAAE